MFTNKWSNGFIGSQCALSVDDTWKSETRSMLSLHNPQSILFASRSKRKIVSLTYKGIFSCYFIPEISPGIMK